MTKVILLTIWCTIILGSSLTQYAYRSDYSGIDFWGKLLNTCTWGGFIYWFSS